MKTTILLLILAGCGLFANEIPVATTNKIKLCLDKNHSLKLLPAGKQAGFPKTTILFKIYNGRNKQYVKTYEKKNKPVSKGIFVKNFSSKDFDWEITLCPKNNLFEIKSEINNKSNKELWLEPKVIVRVADLKYFSSCWLGKAATDEIPKNGQTLSRCGVKYPELKSMAAGQMPFPVTALANNRTALFAGGLPFAYVSYFASRIKADADRSGELEFSIRVVCAPKEKVRNTFVIGCANTKFGIMNGIVQEYYDNLPGLFQPPTGKNNPYIWGAHGHYLSWYCKPGYEVFRRLYSTLDWAYCPYKRSGDILCRPELWNYKLANKDKKNLPILGGKRLKWASIPRKDFLELRRKSFLKYGKKFGWMFYCSLVGTWCEERLARAKYPDAIVKDKEVKNIWSSWSTARDREVRTFPYGTSMQKVFEKDLKTLVAQLDLPGFAFDCNKGCAYYRGPGVKNNIPGRAWDDKSVFIDQSVSMIYFADYVHNIIKTNNPAKKLAVFSNGYLKGDYFMKETSPMGRHFKKFEPLEKYYKGQRPGCFHGRGYQVTRLIPNWRQKPKKYIEDIILKLADLTIFSEFEYGLTASWETMRGSAQMQYAMPEVLELMRIGWQAVVPVEFDIKDKIIHKARYGRGVNTCVFLANPYPQNYDALLRINNQFLGAGKYVFVRKMRDCAKSVNIITNNDTTMKLQLLSRVPIILEAVCGFSSVPDRLTAKTESIKDIDKIKYNIRLDNNNAFKSSICFRTVNGFRLKKVFIDGQGVEFKNGGDMYKISDMQLKTNSSISLEYVSDCFNNSASKLLNFPFTDKENNIKFHIAVPANANKKTLELAEYFVKYFEFCRKYKLVNPKTPALKIRHYKTMKHNCLALVPNVDCPIDMDVPDGVTVKNNVIYLKSVNAETLKGYLKRTLRILDKKFVWFYPMRPWTGLPTNFVKHFKLMNKVFPYKKYFESKSLENI
jgi:hypothetical protein